MPEYTLHYWPAPFRGQFIRAALAHIGADWDEGDAISLRNAAPENQAVPHMGPPVLTDHDAEFSLSQMPAIMSYLGRKHDLIPKDPRLAALADKIMLDANDVLYEMTRYNGAQMWTPGSWNEFRPRLARWMHIFEALGVRHGLSPKGGTMLGTELPGTADLATFILWGTMTEKLPALRPLLDEEVPAISALCDRLAALPEQKELRERSNAEYGDVWCGGQIEASLRAVL